MLYPEVLESTIQLKNRHGEYHCNTSAGFFSIYLPLPDINGESDLVFIKVTNDANQVTIWGRFINDANCILLSHKVNKLRLTCDGSVWIYKAITDP